MDFLTSYDFKNQTIINPSCKIFQAKESLQFYCSFPLEWMPSWSPALTFDRREGLQIHPTTTVMFHEFFSVESVLYLVWVWLLHSKVSDLYCNSLDLLSEMYLEKCSPPKFWWTFQTLKKQTDGKREREILLFAYWYWANIPLFIQHLSHTHCAVITWEPWQQIIVFPWTRCSHDVIAALFILQRSSYVTVSCRITADQRRPTARHSQPRMRTS